MKFYISSKRENESQVRYVVEKLKEHGWKQTYDWASPEAIDSYELDVAESAVDGIDKSDVFILLLPGGRGTHVELGIAIGKNKPIEAWAEYKDFFENSESTNLFYGLPNVRQSCDDIDKFIDNLIGNYNK